MNSDKLITFSTERAVLNSFVEWRASCGYAMGRKRVFDGNGAVVSDQTKPTGAWIQVEKELKPTSWFARIFQNAC